MFGCSSHVDLNSDVCQGRSMGGERGWHFASIAELISLITRSVSMGSTSTRELPYYLRYPCHGRSSLVLLLKSPDFAREVWARVLSARRMDYIS